MKDFFRKHGLYLFEMAILTVAFVLAQECNPPNREIYSVMYCLLAVIATAIATDDNGGGNCCG